MLNETTPLPKRSKEDLVIDVPGIKKAAALVRALNHPVRQRILKVIRSEGSIAVRPLYRKLNLMQCVASQQLGILRQAGLVTGRREGKYILYSVNRERFHQFALALEQFVKNGK